MSNSGWNRPASDRPETGKGGKAPSKWRGIAAGLAIAVPVLALCLFLFSGGDARQDAASTRGRGRIRDARPASAAKSAATSADETRGKTAAEGRPASAADETRGKSAADEEASAAEPAKKKLESHPVFKNPTDQLIYLAVFASGEGPIPPLPQISRADTDRFIETFRRPLDIDKDDPPAIREMKEQINAVREQIAGFIAQEPDKDLSDVLNAHRNDYNHRLNLRADAQTTYDKFMAEEDPEVAEAYRQKVNEILGAHGINPIPAPEEADETESERN